MDPDILAWIKNRKSMVTPFEKAVCFGPAIAFLFASVIMLIGVLANAK